MRNAVSVVGCKSYEPEDVRPALEKALEPLGGLDFVKPGMRVVIKANLVSMLKPASAATTHPALLTELCRMLVPVYRKKGSMPRPAPWDAQNA